MVAFTSSLVPSVSLPDLLWFRGGGVWLFACVMWGSFLQESEKIQC